MPKHAKLGKTRHDKWWHLAKEQGFRSRAAFKLIQLNKKYNFLQTSQVLIDLCAAPGGWLQVAAKYMPQGSVIMGFDLLPIKPIRGVLGFTEDITSQKCRNIIKRECKGKLVDVFLHDGSPNVGGATWLKDAYGQNELVLVSLKLAVEFLRPGGHFITKVFRSQDYNALLWVLQKFFKKTEVTKPVASRNTSAEIYVICQGFLAPKSIDPRLLDPAHVFVQVDPEKKAVDVMKDKNKAKRHRDGYEDGMSVLFKQCPVVKFIDCSNSEAPVLLGSFNRLVWDQDSVLFAQHSDTTEEIKTLMNDLKVLGKSDFSALLKWRLKMKKYKDEIMQETVVEGGAEEEDATKKDDIVAEPDEEKDDEALAEELSALEAKAARKARLEKRKRREKIFKERKRAALNIHSADGFADAQEDESLFSLANGAALMEHSDEDAEIPDGAEQEDENAKGEDDLENDIVTGDDENDELFHQLEEDLDAMYEQYRERHRILSREQNKKMKETGLASEETEDASLEVLAKQVQQSSDNNEDDDIDDEDVIGKNPLVVSFGEETESSARERAARWFSRDTFDSLDTEDGEDTAEVSKPQKRKRDDQAATKSKTKARHSDARSESDSESDDDENKIPATASLTNGNAASKSKKKDDFEEVPIEDDMSSDSDAQAEVLALGTKMIRKSAKNDMIDAGFNRYAWNDADLPTWFMENEHKHQHKQLPITKDEVDAFKLQLKAISARPIRKIAEAKARKKHKAAKRWEKLKNQAEQVADNSSLSAKEKLQSIQKIYAKKDKTKKKVDRTYVVAKKSGGKKQIEARQGAKGPIKLVDTRMKKDKRAMKAAGRKSKRRKH